MLPTRLLPTRFTSPPRAPNTSTPLTQALHLHDNWSSVQSEVITHAHDSYLHDSAQAGPKRCTIPSPWLSPNIQHRHSFQDQGPSKNKFTRRLLDVDRLRNVVGKEDLVREVCCVLLVLPPALPRAGDEGIPGLHVYSWVGTARGMMKDFDATRSCLHSMFAFEGGRCRCREFSRCRCARIARKMIRSWTALPAMSASYTRQVNPSLGGSSSIALG